ncbi:hypothetical protein BV20DRAFT_703341 [Pilatotrama ljubarskyi]|nr:hypothetical protein BV20DRAFT_703341 [Pilatotrama ljubarskyi]
MFRTSNMHALSPHCSESLNRRHHRRATRELRPLARGVKITQSPGCCDSLIALSHVLTPCANLCPSRPVASPNRTQIAFARTRALFTCRSSYHSSRATRPRTPRVPDILSACRNRPLALCGSHTLTRRRRRPGPSTAHTLQPPRHWSHPSSHPPHELPARNTPRPSFSRSLAPRPRPHHTHRIA